MRARGWGGSVVCLLALGVAPWAVAVAQIVYKCPGNLYTDSLSAKEANDKGCKALEGAPVTVIQSAPPRRAAEPATAAPSPRPADSRVAPSDQRERDADKRRILEDELRREEEKLAVLKREYNNGEPERRGDERNYQKYLDRVAEMKAGIERSESDVTALRRELAKLGGG